MASEEPPVAAPATPTSPKAKRARGTGDGADNDDDDKDNEAKIKIEVQHQFLDFVISNIAAQISPTAFCTMAACVEFGFLVCMCVCARLG